MDPRRRLPAKGDFRAIHLENPGIPAGSALSRGNLGSRQKAQLHQTPGIVARKIDTVHHGRFTPPQVNQPGRTAEIVLCRRMAIDTELQHYFTMKKFGAHVKDEPWNCSSRLAIASK
jgi:hypothetical protein